MIPYFPLDGEPWEMKMGTAALVDRPLIEVDLPRYRAELAEKAAILTGDHRYYFQAAPGTETAQWDVVELLLPHMASYYPAHFALDFEGDRWTWRNHLLGTETSFAFGDPASLPVAPLDWVGREVQEDLLLMSPDPAKGFPLVAGQLCFAAGWDLDEMMGRSFLSIHDDVARFHDEIGRSSNLLMARLKAERPVWRANWSLGTTDELNLAPRFWEDRHRQRPVITAENAGDRCFFRVERQTLSRLARSQHVLFTIHTYVSPIRDVAADPERTVRLARFIREMHPLTYAYKHFSAYAEPLLAYLDRRVGEQPVRVGTAQGPALTPDPSPVAAGEGSRVGRVS